ncbi:FCD domain protein (plasmid) [Caballeronia sp. SBC1]|uniref:GntR family transcriptional regulator n=1 Tax=unclassified Caballeronia TaxID=2646786 RepID=UPI0013E1D955|nr:MULTISPECIES: GntR family transcriptional regulator [unclassified Caballeronia]QIE28131.1 FCD domain protein [Caballeronia sp. SBC2]QIN66193.1 FCD domain protein [Caballeronia sp. SBC1]
MSNAAKSKLSDAPVAKTVERDRNIDETMRSVSDELEEQIVLGVLHPRERLVEDDLCERFNLKRHVARQVLAEVERRGLVERRKNVGALVKSYTPREVIELYALRELLEADAARRIVFPVSSEALDALEVIQAEHDEAADAGDLRRVFRANMAFHHAFFALSESQVLTEAIREYERRTHAIRSVSIVFPQYLEKARAEHHQMIEALRAADRESLIKLCREHLVPSRDAYLEAHHRRSLSYAAQKSQTE